MKGIHNLSLLQGLPQAAYLYFVIFCLYLVELKSSEISSKSFFLVLCKEMKINFKPLRFSALYVGYFSLKIPILVRQEERPLQDGK